MDEPGRREGRGSERRPDYKDRYGSGRDDKHKDGKHRYYRPSYFSGFFFYPGFSYGFYYPYWGFDYGVDLYYSPYYHYGYYPYVYGPRTVVVTPPAYTYQPVPYSYYGNDYYLNPAYRSGLSLALGDIRNAWLNGNDDLILRHIDAGRRIDVYLDGEYSYSLPASDYQNMARDAVGNIRTVSFDFYKVTQRSDGAYVAYGTHEFYDQNGNRKAVYVSYTLMPAGGNWVIVAAGSSSKRLG